MTSTSRQNNCTLSVKENLIGIADFMGVRDHCQELESVVMRDNDRLCLRGLTRGDHFVFLNADDVWFPEKRKARIRYLRGNRRVYIVFDEFVPWRGNAAKPFAPSKDLLAYYVQLNQADAARSA